MKSRTKVGKIVDALSSYVEQNSKTDTACTQGKIGVVHILRETDTAQSMQKG